MSIHHQLRIWFAGILVLFALSLGTMAPGQTENALPVVTNASVPFYPRIAQAAHITGEVWLLISTDGTRVSSISVESGPPMLVPAAKENIKTWQFEKHRPTKFETTFHYNLIPGGCDANCNCDRFGHQTVLLRLPLDVEVTAKTMELCDPATTIKH